MRISAWAAFKSIMSDILHLITVIVLGIAVFGMLLVWVMIDWTIYLFTGKWDDN